jgi:hypothetical protein
VAALGAAVAVALVVLGVLALTGGDDDEPEVLEPIVTTSTTTTSTTRPTTTSTAAPTTTTAAPPTTPAPPPFDPGPGDVLDGFADPFEAVADWAWSAGLNYQGACDFMDSTADYGPDPWCGTLWEDRGSVEVYRVADFPGGEFAYWVLVGDDGSGWVVREIAEDESGAPPF